MSAPPLVLKDDLTLLQKVLRVSLSDTDAASASDPDAMVQLAGLGAELTTEAASEPELTTRWGSLSKRRALFDRALVGRLSAGGCSAVDYLVSLTSTHTCARAHAPPQPPPPPPPQPQPPPPKPPPPPP